jgi:hypothetical protein
MNTLFTNKWLKWGAAFCLAFCLALLLTSPVHAEGETPPEPVPTEEVTTSDAPTVPEEPPPEESPPVEVPVEETAPPECEVVALEEPVVEETTQEVSEALALAEESGVALVESIGDPYFKVGTAKYCFMASGSCDSSCTYCNGTLGTSGPPTLTPIADAVNAIAGGLLPTDRKIYVEGGTYNENVKISAVADPILGQLKGLIGVDGASNTTINGYVDVDTPAAGFTLSGFTVNGYVLIGDATGTIVLKDMDVRNTGGTGILVGTTGSVELNGVESSGNWGYGASIYSSGSPAYTVKITNSEFDDNIGPGNAPSLDINASGPVTLDSVTASRNRGNGVAIHTLTSPSLTVKNSQFNDNYENPDGENQGYGLYIDAMTTSAVVLLNVMANDNENDNIAIFTRGTVIATDVEASGSLAGSGLYIQNSLGTSTRTVKVTRGVFKNNHDEGLYVNSLSSVILLNIIAEFNTFASGVYLDNCVWDGSKCLGSGSVTLGGVMLGSTINAFSHNGGHGLQIESRGNVTLSNLDAYDNSGAGVHVDNCKWDSVSSTCKGIGNVTISATAANWTNGFWDNNDHGLYIFSNGNILVDKSTFEWSGGYGAFLDNWWSILPKTVTVKNSSASYNGDTGLLIMSSGHTTLLANSGFWENGLVSGGNGISIYTKAGNVIVTGSSISPTSFGGNNDYGLFIDINGSVSLNYVQAWGNLLMGAYINNSSTLVRPVSVGNSAFNENQSSGLEVYSLGNILLNTVNASNNSSYGAYLDNCMESGGLCTGTGSVTITAPLKKTNYFSDSWNSSGLEVRSRGNITLVNVVADRNDIEGASLLNAYSYVVGTLTYKSLGNVTLSATTDQFNSFSYNQDGYGLYVKSFGNISLARLYVEHNVNYGAILTNNAASPIPKTVRVTNGWFNYNLDDGLKVNASGSIILSGVQAIGNSLTNQYISIGETAYEFVNEDEYGSRFDQWYFTGNGLNVTITVESDDFVPSLSVSSWNDYNPNRLNTASVSFLTVAGANYTIQVHASDRPDDAWLGGAYVLDLNDPSHANIPYMNVDGLDLLSDSGGVTIAYSALTRYGADLGNNSIFGARIEANGPISLSKINAWHNGQAGAVIDNDAVASAPVTLSGVYADDNCGLGIFVDTNGTTTFSTGSASRNDDLGLYAITKGAIIISGLNASWNKDGGVLLENDLAATALGVTIANSTFNHNQEDGLDVYTKGNITLNNVHASGNSLQGGWLDIHAHGQTQEEHLGDFNETDIWWFYYDPSYGAPISIEVDSDGSFTPYLEIYYGSTDFFFGSDHPLSGSHAVYTFNPGWSGYFLVMAGGGSGHYDISIDDTPDTYWQPEPIIDGAHLNNTALGSTANLVISAAAQTYFSGNNTTGIDIQSKGIVSVTNANASANGDCGMRIDHILGTPTVTVKSSSSTVRSEFSRNAGSGLLIESESPITLLNIMTSSNGEYGAKLDNHTITTAKTISVTNSRFGYNFYAGLNAHASGAISLYDVWANGNQHWGIYLDNHDVTAIQPITVKKTMVNGNDATGLWAESRGVITLDNVTAQFNLEHGAYLDNTFSGATGGIIISGALGENRFEGNKWSGLFAYSLKAISANRITSQWNGEVGVYFDNFATGAGSGNITLSNANVRHNGYQGLFMQTYGWVNLNLVSSISNGWNSLASNDGAYISLFTAYTSPIGNPVRITNSFFQSNWGSGIELWLPGSSTKYEYIYNTAYMGNDVGGGSFDPNLDIYHY